jgi:muramoyltetrapeptide carboxypeptidase
VIGYSDITALLLALHQQAGLVTFHGPVARAPMPRFSREHFQRLLGNPAAAGPLGSLPVPADVLLPRENRIVTITPGTAEGPLIGGNLTLLHCLIGTRWFPDLDGALLFLEDVGEELYAIDRMLAHLRSIGSLSKLAGAVIGRFSDMKRSPGDGALGLEDVLRTYFAPLGVPAAFGFPIGHIDDQWTIPIGVRARFDAEAGEVALLGSAVA